MHQMRPDAWDEIDVMRFARHQRKTGKDTKNAEVSLRAKQVIGRGEVGVVGIGLVAR